MPDDILNQFRKIQQRAFRRTVYYLIPAFVIILVIMMMGIYMMFWGYHHWAQASGLYFLGSGIISGGTLFFELWRTKRKIDAL